MEGERRGRGKWRRGEGKGGEEEEWRRERVSHN
jgi:hypothetical protein